MSAGLDWRLLRDLLDLRNRFHAAVEQALAAHAQPRMAAAAPEPAVDVWENDEEVVVEVELPGVEADAIDLRLTGDTLLVAGTFAPPAVTEGTLQRCERPRGRFQRTVRLPVEVAGEPVASLARGILAVRLRKGRGGRRIVPITMEAP